MKSKNILILGPYSEKNKSPLPGGIARWIFDFVTSNLTSNCNFKIVDMSIIGDRTKKKTLFSRIKNELYRTLFIYKQTNEMIKKYSFDYAHFHTACGKFGIIRDFFILKKLQKKKIKIITHFHCNVHLHATQTKLTFLFFKKVLKISRLIVTLNEVSRDYALTIRPTCKVVKLPNFISASDVRKTDKIINSEPKNFICVGFVKKAKGSEEIFEIAKLLPEKNFILIGPMDPKYKNLKLPINITHISYATRDVIYKYLDQADVFLFPSHSEGFSIALLEAMARGLPIICSNVGANSEMVENGVGGIVIEVQRVDMILNSIREINDVNLRIRFSKRNIEKVLSSYTESVVLNQIVDLYYS